MKKALHIGPAKSGTLPHGFPSHEWEEYTLDLDPVAKPDILGSMTDMSVIETGSFDGIFTSHTIEHLYPDDVKKAMEECLRVLKPDGFLLLSCPDIQTAAVEIAKGNLLGTLYESGEGPIAAIDVVFGYRGYFTLLDRRDVMTHRTGFTLPVMIHSLESVGFPSVAGKRRLSSYEMWVYASKKALPQDELMKRAEAQIPE